MSSFFQWLYDGICTIYKSAYEAVYAVCKYVYDWVISIGAWLWEFLFYLFSLLKEFLFSVFDFLFSLLLSSFSYFIGLLPSYDLSSFEPAMEVFIHYVSLIDCIFPVTELFYCVTTYLLILVMWIVYKFIKSWLPTVSGS